MAVAIVPQNTPLCAQVTPAFDENFPTETQNTNKFLEMTPIPTISITFFMSLAFSATALCSSLERAGGSFTYIAQGGDAAPDSNGIFAGDGFDSIPFINKSGDITFNASLVAATGPTSTPEVIYLYKRGSGLNAVAAQGDTTADGDGVYSIFYDYPVISANSIVSFRAFVQNSSMRGSIGLFAHGSSSAFTIARSGDEFLDSNGSQIIGTFGNFRLPIFSNDAAYFQGVQLNTSAGTFLGNETGYSTLSFQGETILTNTTIITLNETTGRPTPNSLNEFAQYAGISRDGGSVGLALLHYKDNSYNIIAETGQALPELGGSLSNLGVASFPSINDNGDILFTATIDHFSQDYTALFMYDADDNNFVELIRWNSLFPSTTRQIRDVTAAKINEKKEVLALVRFRDGGGAIALWENSKLISIATTGELAPGEGPSITHDQFLGLQMNNRSEIVFNSVLSNGAISTYHYYDGTYKLVMKTGDSFADNILVLPLFWGITSDGFSLNDKGELAFQYTLSDRNEGIAIWSGISDLGKFEIDSFSYSSEIFTINYETTIGKSYQLQGSLLLQSWFDIGDPKNGTGNIETSIHNFPKEQKSHFYRVIEY